MVQEVFGGGFRGSKGLCEFHVSMFDCRLKTLEVEDVKPSFPSEVHQAFTFSGVCQRDVTFAKLKQCASAVHVKA